MSSALQAGDKNYLQLFKFIEKQKEYDEEALKKHFAKTTFIHYLSSEKSHLYKLILKSLRAFHSENSVGSILKLEIKNVEILYDKALFKECEKYVLKAKELAKQYEKFYYWFELLSWQKKLLEEAYESGEFHTDLDALIQEEGEVIDKLRNLAEYEVLYSRINFLFRSGGFSRTPEERREVDAIADHPLIKGKNTAISTSASSICYYIKGLCAATNRSFEEAYGYFNRTRTILEDNPKIKEDNPLRLLSALEYMSRCLIETKDFGEAFELIRAIDSLKDNPGFTTLDLQIKMISRSHFLQIRWHQIQGNYEQTIPLFKNLELEWRPFLDKVNKEQWLMFYYYRSISRLGLGDYRLALRDINEILNDKETHLRQDIYSFARILNLIIHFEMGNFDFLEYVIKSTNRYISNSERTLKTEEVLIEALRKMARQIHSEKKGWAALSESLKQLQKDENERVVEEYFDLRAWVERKVQLSQ